jgi:hypothetical protein
MTLANDDVNIACTFAKPIGVRGTDIKRRAISRVDQTERFSGLKTTDAEDREGVAIPVEELE